MASRSGIVLRASCVAALGSIFGMTWDGSLATAGAVLSDPPVCVYQYAPPRAEAYFALAVRGNAGQPPATNLRDHLLLVDTSASQSGAYRQREMEIVSGYLAILSDED